MRIRYFLLSLLTITLLNADTITWQTTGTTDWFTGSNWSTGNVPGPTDIAQLVGPLSVDEGPSVSGAANVDGIYMNNGYNHSSYITGDGSLTIGLSGITLSWFSLYIYPEIIIGTNQTWVLNESTREGNLNLYGGISGNGRITLETQPTEYRGHSRLYYKGDPADVTFTGGIKIHKDVDEPAYFGMQYELGVMSAPTSFSFGTGHIIGDNATFVAYATADSGGKTPGHIIQITNPLKVEEGGLVLISNQGGNVADMPNIQFSGPIDLGGLLSSGSAQYGAMAPITGDITIRQSMAARAGLCGRQYDYQSRNSQASGGISDGIGGFGNPLILRNHNQSLYISGDAVNMTYSNGTVVDQCGSDYSSNTRSASVSVDAGSKLGVGGVKVLPGGMLNLSADSNIEDDMVVEVESSGVASGVVVLSYDGLPEIKGSGVLAIDDTFSSNLDMSTLGDGYMFLGSRNGGKFSGTNLIPGAGNVYRLGGAVQSRTLTIENSVLTGNADLQVGCAKQRGGGTVYLSSTNDFSGNIDVIGLPGFWREPDITDHGSFIYGIADVNGGSPFGSTNGTVSLHCGRYGIIQASSSSPSLTHKATLEFEGRGRLQIDANNFETIMSFGSIDRLNNGVLSIYSERNSLGVLGKILIDNPPLQTNGMMPPWIIAERSKTLATDQYFMCYDSTGGLMHFTNEVTDVNAVTETDVFGGGGVLTADRTCYAARVSSDLTGSYTLNVTGGGLIVNSHISCNIDFGASEGVVYNRSIRNINGKISGSGGITFSGQDGHIRLMNNDNDFTGGIAINGGTVYADFDTDAAHGSLGPTSNDIYINGGGLCQHKASGGVGSYLSSNRTITLGTSGGYIAGGSRTDSAFLPIHSKITGDGMLMVDQQNRDTFSGQVVISNPENDYTGGTFLYANSGYPSPEGSASFYRGVLRATEEASLGTGDLMVGSYVTGILQGNANVNAEANVQVAMYGTLQIEASSPSFGSLAGSGNVRLGTSGTSTELSIGGTDKNSDFYGMIYEIDGASPCSVTKVGSGLFKLYGAHRYAGATTVETGTFSLLGSIAGNLVVDEGAFLMAVVKDDGTALLGHVGGDIDFNGTLVLDIPEDYNVPMGTTMTVLTCDGTVTGDLNTEDGYKATIENGEIKVTRVAAGTVIVVQ